MKLRKVLIVVTTTLVGSALIFLTATRDPLPPKVMFTENIGLVLADWSRYDLVDVRSNRVLFSNVKFFSLLDRYVEGDRDEDAFLLDRACGTVEFLSPEELNLRLKQLGMVHSYGSHVYVMHMSASDRMEDDLFDPGPCD